MLIDNKNGTVTDTDTGLMWQQATAPGTYTWDGAISYCVNLTLGGYSDWRLPTIQELISIVDYKKYHPAINADYFHDTKSSCYWTSAPDARSTGHARFVSFYYGDVNYGNKSSSYYVRAVRGGQCL